MVTARHAGFWHVAAAIHGVRGAGRRLRVMMTVNRALRSGRAASSQVERPGSPAKGCVRKRDRNQAQHREERTTTLVRPGRHIHWCLLYSETGYTAASSKRPVQNSSARNRSRSGRNLDLACPASQTRSMAHAYGIYIRFDFGTDEEKAQQARHKLDGWRQAFRLDKRVQYKMDRPESAEREAAGTPALGERPGIPAKGKEKPAAKATAKTGGKSSESKAVAAKEAAADGKVGLLVRLYFSPHEKLSEQRWLARIPAEEPFKGASPKVIHQNDPEFEATDEQFESISQ